MRASVASISKKFISIFFAVALAVGLVPSTALAASDNLQPVPGGSEGVVSVASSVEGGDADTFSHCLSDEPSFADGDGAAISPVEGKPYINEDVPLVATARGYVEVDFMGEPAGTPIESEDDGETILALEDHEISYVQQRRYHVLFDKNGGDWAPAYSNDVVAAYGGAMPDITGYLASEGSVPKREKYVFMGWYDSSVWNSPVATRYYDRDFKDCGKTYPYAADGLRLYAGWAPVLDYTVPTSVSIAVGTVPELGAPTVAAGEIVNRSPWPIECTAITWDATPLAVDESHLIAAEAQIEGLLAKSVQMSASTLDEMFSPLSGVYLDMETKDASASVSPKGTSDASFRVDAESSAPVTYAISLAEGTAVKATEKVSRTTLLTPFQAVVDSSDAVLSTILFDAGEGTGGQIESLKAEKGKELPGLTNKNAPVYEGRTFKGWFDSPDWQRATCYYGESGEPAVDAWNKDADTCLYAGWQVKGCPVLFMAGGEGASLAYGETLTSMLVSVEYGKTLGSAQGFGGRLPVPFWGDYTFMGWYDDEDNRYEGDEVMTSYGTTLVLTARWSGVPVNVTWDASGGAAVSSWDAFPSGSTLGSYGIIPETTREGYAFGGWWANGVQASSDTVVSTDTTFTARWTGKAITLSWDIDGTIVATSEQTYGSGADGRPVTVVIPIDLANPSKEQEGWMFRGWFDDGGAQLLTDTPLPSDNATYFAEWNAYVSFDVNGGAFASADPSGFIACGDKVSMPGTPSREGYEFGGWYAGESKLTADTVVSAPVAYVARWGAESFDITYVLDGGTVVPVGANPSTYTAETETFKLKNPIREGYSFAGWSGTDLEGDDNLDVSIIKGSTGNRSYAAHWRLSPYTITYSGMEDATNPNSTGFGVNELPLTLQEPMKRGYTFDGWTGEGTTTPSKNMSVMSIGDKFYTAHWSIIEYFISYDLDGGIASNPAKYTVETESFMLTEPAKRGYDFKGWSGTDLTGDTNKTVTVAKGCTDNRSYTANWTPWTYTVIFKDTSGSSSNNNPTGPNTVTAGTAYTIPDLSWSWDGYDFLGWSLIEGAKEATYQGGSAIAAATIIDKAVVVNSTPTLYIYPVWKLVFGPLTEEPIDYDGGAFYLHLSAEQATAISTEKVKMEEGYYNADAIKVMADDILDKGAHSDFYEVCQKIRDYKNPDGIIGAMFTAKWKDANTASPYSPNIPLSTWTPYDVRIIGIDQDYLESRTSGKRAALTFQFADKGLTSLYRFNNANNTTTGWQNSELRARMNSATLKDVNGDSCYSPESNLVYGDAAAKESIYKRAPSSIRENLQPVYKRTHNAAGNSTTAAGSVSWTRDEFFIASYADLVASTSTYFTNTTWTAAYNSGWMKDEGVYDPSTSSISAPYQFWKARNISGKGANAPLIKKAKYATKDWSACQWWERSAQPGNATNFLIVVESGSLYGANAANNSPYGMVVPCFCF